MFGPAAGRAAGAAGAGGRRGRGGSGALRAPRASLVLVRLLLRFLLFPGRRVADRRQQVGDIPGRLLGRRERPGRTGGAGGGGRGGGGRDRGDDHRLPGMLGHGVGAVVPGGRGRARRRHVERDGLGAEPAGRRAVRGVPGQRRGDQRHQRRRNAGQVGAPGDDPVEDRLVGAAAERQVAGRGERHRRAPGVHVRGGAARLPLDHLGSQVAGGAHHQPGLGQPGGVAGLGDTEVDHDGPVVGEHHVARLQVAVHYARRVDRGQRLGHAVGEPAQPRTGQRPAGPHHLVQGGPGHEPRDDVGKLAGDVGVEDLGDVRAADPAHGLDLAGQPAARVDALAAERMEHLDRHRTAFRIAGEVNHPHTAFPKAVLKAIRAEGPRQVFRRRHRGFQSTKQIACCGANKMLPICNGAAGLGSTKSRNGREH